MTGIARRQALTVAERRAEREFEDAFQEALRHVFKPRRGRPRKVQQELRIVQLVDHFMTLGHTLRPRRASASKAQSPGAYRLAAERLRLSEDAVESAYKKRKRVERLPWLNGP